MNASISTLPLPPEDAEEDLKRRVLSGNFQITLQRVDQRAGTQVSLQMTGPVYTDDGMRTDPLELDHRVDRYQSVIDRQLVQSDIQAWEKMIEGEVINLDLMAKQKDGLDTKRDSGAKLNSTDKQKLQQYDSARDAALDRMAKLQAQISKAKQKIGVEI